MSGALAPAALFQVTLTGARPGSVDENQLLQRLQARFKLAEQQARAMLGGRVVIKRGVDAAGAAHLVKVFAELGLEAVAEPTAAPAAAPKPASVPAPAPVGMAAALAAAESETTTVAKLTSPALDRLRALGTQRIPQPRISILYGLNLLIVTLLCIAIPLLYAVLTGGVTFVWLWYLTHLHQYVLLASIPIMGFLYVVPGAAGLLLVMFLLRPVFTKRPPAPPTIQISADTEPEFVSGVHALCKAIGVKPPSEIHVTWQVNAWVHFRRGWRDIFSHDKVLTIGLPLLQGLSAREFVGVLAHEFGHFAQRSGMTSSYIINTVNGWLERCAYGSDAFENGARSTMQGSSSLLALGAGVALLMIKLIRLVMKGLFHLSLRLSKSMSRHMEFDADRYEAVVAGSDCFGTTSRNLRALTHAFNEISRANASAWQENRLLRDLPEAVAEHFRGFSAARLQAVRAEMGKGSPIRYWDSHPPDLERVQNAERQKAPGIYLEAAPASSLLLNARRLSERVTLAYYKERGIKHVPNQLRAREEVLGKVEERDQHDELLSEYFNGQLQYWPLLPLEVRADRPAAALSWQACIDEIRRRSPDIARSWRQAAEAENAVPRMQLAAALGLNSRRVGLRDAVPRDSGELSQARQQIVQRDTDYYRHLADSFDYLARRVDCAIAAMQGSEQSRAADLRRTLVELQAQERHIGVVQEFSAASILLANSIGPETSQAVREKWHEIATVHAEHVLKLWAAADGIAQSVTGEKTLGGYLRARCPRYEAANSKDPAAVLRTTTSLPHALAHFYRLALGELIALCWACEKANGIKPIRLMARA